VKFLLDLKEWKGIASWRVPGSTRNMLNE